MLFLIELGLTLGVICVGIVCYKFGYSRGASATLKAVRLSSTRTTFPPEKL